MRIGLEMPADADPKDRARLTYAFRLFCAIYGHEPVAGCTKSACSDVTLCYGSPIPRALGEGGDRVVWLSRGYRARDVRDPAPPPFKYASHDVSTVLHYPPLAGSVPDWLGEIFEWVSCADEYSVTERDGVGRALFSATYAGRHELDTSIPYAAVAMRCLQREICRVVPRAAEEPIRPKAAHLVVPTHDVDYFPAGRPHAVNRLARNAVISYLSLKRPKLALRQAAMAASVAVGLAPDPLDRIAALVEEEQRRGIGASYNFLARHKHRRDAHYGLDRDEVVKTMRWLQSQGMEVGIHHTYTCLDDPGTLADELALFRSHGFFPRGGRQHWLRCTLDRLIPAVERAGLAYDTSIGYSEKLGFRAGACFAFPPYNFEEERASNFIEIPLAMMDQAFPMQHQSSGKWFEAAAALLAASRRLAWGGISLLWHPPALGEGWLPAEVGELYLRLADSRAAWGDEWISPQNLVASIRHRYVDAGLLPAQAPAKEIPVEESAAVAVETLLAASQGQRASPMDSLSRI